jgi:SAM-dependent methyltransferase
MKIITRDTISEYLGQQKSPHWSNWPHHPYIREGRTNEYLLLHDALRKLLSSLDNRNAGRVLDLGGGDGMLTKLLVDKFKHVTAVDTDKNAIGWLAEAIGRKNVFHTDALGFLQSADDKYRVIMMSHLLYYFPEAMWRGIFEQVLCRLERNGVLIVCLWSGDCEAAEVYRALSRRRGERVYGERAIEVAASLGLSVASKTIVEAQHCFPESRMKDLVRFFALDAADRTCNAAALLEQYKRRDAYVIDQRDVVVSFRRH